MEAPLLVLFIILILITVNNLRDMSISCNVSLLLAFARLNSIFHMKVKAYSPLVVIFRGNNNSSYNGVESIAFTFKNNCPYTIWPGTLSGASSPILSSTGFELPNGATFTLDAPTPWSGRFWARSLCHSDATGKFSITASLKGVSQRLKHKDDSVSTLLARKRPILQTHAISTLLLFSRCSTGDCGSGEKSCNGKGGAPPATLAEFTLGGSMNKDFYDISLVDGFNLPLSVVPQGVTNECPATSCAADLNTQCPDSLSFKDTKGSTIGCKSACLAFNQPQYCCTGEYKTPQTCPPTNQSLYFKNQCPQAYSYAYDDPTSTFTCPTGVNYFITFCP
ncbi:thaumatin-like protein 1 [Chenopodium quinoa]|uniref:thaumatin-like protein 1 n=1 Tax=Chenopodium quinoa TaxID=63459 RepID=UPI000B77F278|nr:thaumatin-like protein 1 [Chenopodium quinoa]